MKKLFFLAAISACVFTSCYKDKLDEIYPGIGLFTPCDSTAHPSYSTHIAPIVQNFCIGCHSSSNPNGGANLSTYSGVFPWTANGTSSVLVGASWHKPGFHPMPPGYQLDSCQLRQIYNWCLDGSPNN
ncbi:MAG: hypothetical protein NT084_06445 [Bacteroidetes bacterium]|nr:hypothetical protein [Bacteroidota bacterium]